jgi:hypothetical protein
MWTQETRRMVLRMRIRCKDAEPVALVQMSSARRHRMAKRQDAPPPPGIDRCSSELGCALWTLRYSRKGNR